MDKKLFYEIILFAEERGFKAHLDMLPVMPTCKTSYEALAEAIFWEKRYEIIFNHEFALAIFSVHPNDKYYKLFNCPDNNIIDFSQMYLQQMVIEEDPFQYLKEQYEKI